MFVYVRVQEVDDKNSLTNPSASPMKQLAFNRSPKQAISVRDINKPRPSTSTSIDGTPYFSGTYDSEDPDDSEDADTPSDSSGMGDLIEHSYKVLFVPDTDVECVTVQSK